MNKDKKDYQNSPFWQEKALEAMATVVAAYVTGVERETEEVLNFAESVYERFSAFNRAAGTGVYKPYSPSSAQNEKNVPAVPIDSSVTDDCIYCLICGEGLKVLTRHLKTKHGKTFDQYLVEWNLPAKYPCVANVYSRLRGELAKRFRLGFKNPKKKAFANNPMFLVS